MGKRSRWRKRTLLYVVRDHTVWRHALSLLAFLKVDELAYSCSLSCTHVPILFFSICSACAHLSSLPVDVWRSMANRSASSRNFYKALSSSSPVVRVVHGVTLRSWGEQLNKNFCSQKPFRLQTKNPLDQGFLTFLLRSPLVKIPTLGKGSLNW